MHKDFTPCDFCRIKINAQISQTTPAKGPCNCSHVTHPQQSRVVFHSCSNRRGLGRICTQDCSTCCTFPGGRVNAPSDTLFCILASLQGFIICLWDAWGFFYSITPLRDQYPLCCWSLEEDEGWARAEGTTQCSEQVTVTWDATASGWKMGFICRHK